MSVVGERNRKLIHEEGAQSGTPDDWLIFPADFCWVFVGLVLVMSSLFAVSIWLLQSSLPDVGSAWMMSCCRPDASTCYLLFVLFLLLVIYCINSLIQHCEYSLG